LNKVIMIGRMTAEAEFRTTSANKSVSEFSLAVNRTFQKGKEDKVADFFNVVCWEKLAEIIRDYGEKGKQVCVEGRWETKSWEDKHQQKRKNNYIVAERIELLGKKGDNEGRKSNDGDDGRRSNVDDYDDI